jgi:thioredoxin reductase (NADPH)
MATDYDVIVIGEGVAGLTAAGELAGAGLKVATIEAQLFGGLVININELEPAPAGSTGGGAEYASSLVEAAANAGVTSINEPVSGIESTGDIKKVVMGGGAYTAKQVVVASGARLKKLGVPGEAEFEGKGVSQCADCDGPMYQNEVAVVVGGGDSALQESMVLAQYCKEVRLVHRGSAFSGNEHLQQAVNAEPKIVKIFNAEVTAVGGGQMVEKVAIKHADGRAEDIACAGLFAYIGLEPNADFLPDSVQRDVDGRVVTNDKFETAVPGVWAVGAVRSGCGGLLDDAIADGKKAAAEIRARFAKSNHGTVAAG